ncbi:hypothetical protein LF41_1179 [Lysobacter dokdonensis DS-58]|uniref:Uncharacterized protein n=1 Tax=Lysobacter dokdonensis DS-58 TaxID=1300345 RepID=A0A0A2WKC9_9GAMM|nr:hypothetical protein LF41_1179 [Lysobacter dokdonensis DS-58]
MHHFWASVVLPLALYLGVVAGAIVLILLALALIEKFSRRD